MKTAGFWWCIPVILLRAEIRRIAIGGQPRQNNQTPFAK
jgi:hypothetical protein